MYYKLFGATLLGIEGKIIEVEVDITRGLPSFNIVGLPDAAIRESRERIRSAIQNLGFQFPLKRVTVNLSPSSLKKKGNFLDLPIALGILLASGQINYKLKEQILFVGSLSLDGKIKVDFGILPILLAAKLNGFEKIILPISAYLPDLDLQGISMEFLDNLIDVVNVIQKKDCLSSIPLLESKLKLKNKKTFTNKIDFSDIKGQKIAKRALEIAVAGEHNVLMIGVPGCGKSMLASAVPSIMPPLTKKEKIETSLIYSSVGGDYFPILKDGFPPFRSPHHSSSLAGIFGGGISPTPGEISLAHNGVLFLDELPEFPRGILERLRQPLVEKKVSIVKSGYHCEFPAKFILIAAANPCPCGYYGDKDFECKCNPYEIERYRKKISGPLLDRIDMVIQVEKVPPELLVYGKEEESSSVVRERIMKARLIQKNRYSSETFKTNGELNSKLVNKYIKLDSYLNSFYLKILKKQHFSARSYYNILKVARTIADLDGKDKLEPIHLIEAINYRLNFEK